MQVMTDLPRRRVVALSLPAVLSLAAGLAVAPASARAQAADPAAAEEFIRKTGNDMVALVNARSLSVEERRRRIGDLLRRAVDIDGVGRFVLGRYWRVASADERATYLRLFEQIIVRNLSARFGELQGVKFTINRGQQRTEEDVIVPTTIERPNSAPAVVEWRVARLENGQLRIVDVVAEGTSLRLTTRSDYSAVIQRGGGKVQALLDAMRGQLDQIAAREQAQGR